MAGRIYTICEDDTFLEKKTLPLQSHSLVLFLVSFCHHHFSLRFHPFQALVFLFAVGGSRSRPRFFFFV